MEGKKGTGFYLEALIVIALLTSLTAFAVPNIGQLFSRGKVTAYHSELRNIQVAVAEMLTDSDDGTITPVGPTADMSQVRTGDSPPLILADYLTGLKLQYIRSGCTYTFASDGDVTQIRP